MGKLRKEDYSEKELIEFPDAPYYDMENNSNQSVES